MNRPITTLFMLSSVDGKITTGGCDDLDFDQDLPSIYGVKEGLYQYYDIEQTTDLWSFNTGRVQAKIGVNTKGLPEKSIVSFVLVDNYHLNIHGVEYFCALSKEFVLITTNKNHPAYCVNASNLHIIYQEKLNLKDALSMLYCDCGCDRLTIQSGGTMNCLFLHDKLIDYVDIVVAPVLIGGKDTSSIVDGSSIMTIDELKDVGVLKLLTCDVLEHSYIRLRYEVIS
ncbi:MAG: dihydrofolate reductase family protein [Erysipelotrichaceae bacterium]|nr:dihydrofolate reductase family protein [Erysipelotrichaceae bacterium]